jgi:lipid II:glycine glycyltransferase (peptidoglycan interpeptide bridge formation enzyme)
MHWKIAQELYGAGVRVYNLAGTPIEAAHPEHAAHGLHRFKSGFSPHEEIRRGITYTYPSLHHASHRLFRRILSR